MEGRNLWLRDGDANLIAKASMIRNGMKACAEDSLWKLWHIRFGHLHFGGVKELIRGVL